MTDVDIRLTELATCGGCAAKYSAARLEELLRGFVPVEAERLLVGLALADDAAVYLLDDDRALVFTVDVFPPIVDDAGDYGTIAATNALNDVFAMGGTPLLALSIAAFPEELPSDLLARVFAAAAAQVHAASGLLAGGHTIRDDEPKYGLAVVGTVHPRGIWSKAGARPGDTLFLTKAARDGPDHDGIQEAADRNAAARARGRVDAHAERGSRRSLARVAPHAVTDVTGFGLFGHAYEVASGSGVRIVLDADRLPAIDGALDLARKGVRTSGDPRNRDFAGRRLTLDGVPESLVALGYDPQTAGGLLVSLPSVQGAALEAEFARRRLFLRKVGTVEEGSGVRVKMDTLRGELEEEVG